MTIEEKSELSSTTGTIHHTESFGAVDGPGIRYVFFLQGCRLRCLYCHNPDSTPRGGGKVWTAEQAVTEVLRYRTFLKNGGVTFSGGEPLLQPAFVKAAFALFREKGIHTALDTSGSEDPYEPSVRAAIDESDLLLLDVKAADDEMAKKITGQSNKNALATLEYCEASGKAVWVRHVLLPGYTLEEKPLSHLAALLAKYRCIQRVELLPFHKLGEPKWKEMGWKYQLEAVPAVTKEQVAHARNILKSHGLTAL